MRSTWSEPYLWVHLAGIAAVPIFLELCLLGLKAAESALPAALVFLLVAIAGIGPIVWMQWQRPFSIFSLVFLALKPSELTETQRRILRRFKTPLGKVIAVSVAIAALAILWQLNQWVPLVVLKTKIVPGGSFGGLLLAAVAFLLSNLFLQVPASVLPVLLTSDNLLAATEPYPVTDVSKDFTLIGLRVKQILPKLIPSADAKEMAEVATSPILPEPESASLEDSQPPLPTDESESETPLAAEWEEGQLEEPKAEPGPPEPISAASSIVRAEESLSEDLPQDIQPETVAQLDVQPDVQPDVQLEIQPEIQPELLQSETPQTEMVEPVEPIDAQLAAEQREASPGAPHLSEVSPAVISPIEEAEDAEATDLQTTKASIDAKSGPSVTDTIVAIKLPTPESAAEPTEAEQLPTVEEPANAPANEPSVTDTVVRIEPPII